MPSILFSNSASQIKKPKSYLNKYYKSKGLQSRLVVEYSTCKQWFLI